MRIIKKAFKPKAPKIDKNAGQKLAAQQAAQEQAARELAARQAAAMAGGRAGLNRPVTGSLGVTGNTGRRYNF